MIDLIAYCGLYCPKCYAMVVSEAAINLKKALENTHICGSKHDPSNKFKAELNELVNLKCAVFCKYKMESNCPIRICCIKKGIEGCWECNNTQDCPNLTQQFKENCKRINEIGCANFIEESEDSYSQGGKVDYRERYQCENDNKVSRRTRGTGNRDTRGYFPLDMNRR